MTGKTVFGAFQKIRPSAGVRLIVRLKPLFPLSYPRIVVVAASVVPGKINRPGTSLCAQANIRCVAATTEGNLNPYRSSGRTGAGHLFGRSVAHLFTIKPIACQTTHFVRRLLVVRPTVGHALNQHKFQS